ncbi:protein phosphatase CheZ [Pelagibius sp. Alg239-R121]|uniref:protein phosphatase CheZ n=1 Tax=Pelagibius sp. Alg239-R121 TaxID=2993448 RepID=UPI0024A6F60D|nr:protein phosphatase CheZ [Pelagibius sp. Alg239-R121]
MSQSLPVKEFSAERQLRLKRLGQLTNGKDSGEGVALPSFLAADDGSGVSNAEVLEAIRELGEKLGSGGFGGGGDGLTSDDEQAALEEARDVRIEIAQMVRSIGRAKAEIASIKHPLASESDDKVHRASSELDAIVLDTETATNKILAGNEKIEAAINKLNTTHHDDPDVQAMTEDVAFNVIEILEACNFQDITGQRITKVVNTLRYIEDRILAMISIWGVDAFADLPVEVGDDDREGDDALMNGPALQNEGISQDDIDALFD